MQRGVRNVMGSGDKEIKGNLYNEHSCIHTPSKITHAGNSMD